MNEKVRNLIDETRANDKKRKERQKDFELEWLAAEEYKDKYLLPRLRTASARKYKKWLKGYLAKGGAPTHYYDYEWSGYIAIRDIELKPLFGAQNISIIIPNNVKITGDRGHCNIFLMRDFSCMDCGDFVPVFTNTIV